MERYPKGGELLTFKPDQQVRIMIFTAISIKVSLFQLPWIHSRILPVVMKRMAQVGTAVES